MNHHDVRWRERADEYVRWCKKHRRWPGRSGGVAGEEDLRRWMVTQRSDARMPEARRTYLDRHVPGWDGRRRASRQSPTWERRLAAARYWVVKNRRQPRSGGPGEEGQVYQWLFQQTRRLRPDDERRDRLVTTFDEWDRMYGWWRPGAFQDALHEAWLVSFERHTAWVRENGRRPRARNGQDENAAYGLLYKMARTLPAGDPRRVQLADALPDWNRDTGWW